MNVDPASGPETVLLVEDDVYVRMLGVDVLEEAGYRAIEAMDAKGALDVIKADPHAVSVLLTDVDMPGSMDGHELARTVDRHWPWIRIVITSGKSMIPPREIPDHGRFVPKPWIAETIVRAVEVAGTPE